MPRDYATLESRIQPGDDRARQMESFVETVWPALRDTGVSWIGFYLHESGDALVLGPRRDKPACSPIALHGACGRALTTRRPLVVHDVADLGEEYIACDPRDRSELVIPLFDESGRCWGVLDVDSHAVGAFDDTDVAGFQRLLLKTGLTAREPE